MSKSAGKSPFKKAGYTKKTKFKVLRTQYGFNAGDVVTLNYDDKSNCPEFIGEDGNTAYLFFKTKTGEDGYDSDLEVYTEDSKTSSKTIKFPCVVEVGDLTSEQLDELHSKFISLGAKGYEVFTTAWHYAGVDYAGRTARWDDLGDYDNDTSNIKIYAYDEVMAFGNTTEEEVTIFTPSASKVEPREYQVGDTVRVLREKHDHLIPIGSEVKIIDVTGNTPKYKTDYEVRACWVCDDEIELVVTTEASSNDNIATLEPIEYEGSSSGETVSNQSVGASVAITANISFTVKIKGQEFTLDKDEIQELYIALCSAEGSLQEWSLGQ